MTFYKMTIECFYSTLFQLLSYFSFNHAAATFLVRTSTSAVSPKQFQSWNCLGLTVPSFPFLRWKIPQTSLLSGNNRENKEQEERLSGLFKT